MLYLLGAVFISYRWGFEPALTYSLISTITFDFFFIPPYQSFAVTDFWYFLTAITLMSIALFVSRLIAAVRHQAVVAARREAHTATLYCLVQSLASAHGSTEVLRAAAAQFRLAFGLEVAVLLESDGGRLATQLESAGFRVDDSLHAAAERFFVAARSSPIRREGAFLPLRAGADVIGVMVLSHAGTRLSGGGSPCLGSNGRADGACDPAVSSRSFGFGGRLRTIVAADAGAYRTERQAR
jgi:two-component system sensor histidine kinase KdpD